MGKISFSMSYFAFFFHTQFSKSCVALALNSPSQFGTGMFQVLRSHLADGCCIRQCSLGVCLALMRRC